MGLLDSVLGGIGGGQPQRGGSSPIGMALLGLLAYGAYQNRDKISDVLGGLGARAGMQNGGPGGATGAAGGLGGLLGGLTGGGNGLPQGSLLNQGLGNLLDRFRQNGQEDAARSWVEPGPNRHLEPHEIERAVGPDTIDTLAQQTGLPRHELLDRLKTALPEMVDKLTPEGRLPTDDEARSWI